MDGAGRKNTAEEKEKRMAEDRMKGSDGEEGAQLRPRNILIPIHRHRLRPRGKRVYGDIEGEERGCIDPVSSG